jgi:hypothetical protein
MNEDHDASGLRVRYAELLDVLSRTGKYLDGLGIDQSVLKSYERLLRYLRAQPIASVQEILGEVPPRKSRAAQVHPTELTDREILEMSPSSILAAASDRLVPRREIERIAVLRFGMTAGGLSYLRSRHALIEKLRTLIGNEDTHESIGRAAGRSSSR